MQIETAIAVCKMMEEQDMDIGLTNDYSGRGMFGKGTTALIGNLTEIATYLHHYLFGTDIVFHTPKQVNDFLQHNKYRWDNMGHDSVVY